MYATTSPEAWSVLEEAVTELDPARGWPVDVPKVLGRLGIRWRYERSVRPGVAYLTLGSETTITLNGDAPPFQQMSRRDRFSVAHELGHWLLWRELKIQPASTTAEYWRQEELCNRFAAEFLLPTRALQRFIGSASVPAVEYPQIVADSARVTWHVAARALSGLSGTDLNYLRLTTTCPPGRLRVQCSSISTKPGSFAAQGALVSHSDLERWLSAMRQVSSAGGRRVFPLRLSLSLGSLQLEDVPCSVLSKVDHWIVCFRRSSPGVAVAGLPLELAAPDARAHSLDGCRAEEPVRTVQRLAIEDAARRRKISAFDLAVLLGHSCGKVSPTHLTKFEADTFLQQLYSPQCSRTNKPRV